MSISTNTGRRARLMSLATVTVMAATGLAASPAAAADAPGLPQVSLGWAGEAGGMFGTALSRQSCDVNGDGRPDTLIGDWGWDRPGAANVGAAYVLLGDDSIDGGDIGSPSESGAIRIDGPSTAPQSLVGWSVSCLGDVNGDSIDDLIVGSGSRSYQKAHVVLGKKNFENVDLDFLGTGGFVIEDPNANDKLSADMSTDNFGIAIGEVGDVNGDGFADIGIVDQLADNNGRNNGGRVWIIAGGKSIRKIDLSDAEQRDARVLRTIDGATADERLGTVSSVGDVNGDGIDDFALSSYTATPWGPEVAVAGAAYVVFGQKSSGNVDLSTLGAKGFAVRGPQRSRDRLGISVAGAGDINGDGKADVVIGADGVPNATTGERNGGAAIVYGSASSATVMTLPGATGYSVFACDDEATDTACDSSHKVSRGYWINGAAHSDKIGYSVASLPDVNGDGVPELVLGGQNRSTWLVYGNPKQTKTVELATANSDKAVKLGEGHGYAVGNAGDLDGNGVNDVISGGGNSATVFLLGALKTTTAVEGPKDATFDEKVSFSASSAALVPAVQETQAGTISFAANGAAIGGCTDLAVEGNASATCATTVDWNAGAAKITAMFTPNAGGFAPSTGTHDLAVAKRDTSVRSVALSETSTSYGTGTATATATVKNLTTGKIEFYAGKKVLGTANLSAAGTAALKVPKDLSVGEHTILARYMATENLNASPRTAAEDSLTVTKTPTSVAAPALSAESGIYGKAVRVTGAVKGATAGTVEFRAGSKVMGKAAVGKDGKASLWLPKTLAPGKYKITARYLGTGTAAASKTSAASKQLTVAPAKLAAKTSVTAPAVKKNKKPSVTVHLGKLNNGSYPTGKVSVKSGSWSATVSLKASNRGTLKVSVGKKFAKRGTVTARYLGNSTTSAGAAASTVVKIAK